MNTLPILIPALEPYLNTSQNAVLASIKKKGLFPFTDNELISTKKSLFDLPDPFANDNWKKNIEAEANTLHQVTDLTNKGLLSFQAVDKVEFPRENSHWDAFLQEMKFIAYDIRHHRKHKMYMAKTLSRAVVKYHAEKKKNKERRVREKEQLLKERARWVSRQIKAFWSEIKEWVVYKMKSEYEKEQQEIQKQQLDKMVKQSEKFSEDLAKKFKLDNEDNGDQMRRNSERIRNASKEAMSFQPTGITLSTTKVKTKIPSLLKGKLREYQHIGLDWLVAMYEKKLNGILADEMGLGKTIMTISLLAHLVDQKIWGPHLIIVPTSVLINWEMELKRWCPAFKILTYFGTPKQRAKKRIGWTKPNSFHVCLTSYKIVMQDAQAFRRQKWFYLILDEAHSIKNYRSQRWQTLLNFNTKRRLLLTGTPLQNNLMELWALMHFLMPHIFASHKEFQNWFSNPVNNMIEGSSDYSEDLINRLHSILRPFMLRRLKKDVEKQLPPKREHVIYCRLSKRQRYLYDEFLSSGSVRNSLSGENYLKIANILMQLRKVCNHPDLFESRPIISPFDQEKLIYKVPSLVVDVIPRLEKQSTEILNFEHSYARHRLFKDNVSLDGAFRKKSVPHVNRTRVRHLLDPCIVIPWNENKTEYKGLIRTIKSHPDDDGCDDFIEETRIIKPHYPSFIERVRLKRQKILEEEQRKALESMFNINKVRHMEKPVVMPLDTVHFLIREVDFIPSHPIALRNNPSKYLEYADAANKMVLSIDERMELMKETIKSYVCYIPNGRTGPISLYAHRPSQNYIFKNRLLSHTIGHEVSPKLDVLHPAHIRTQLYFPDKRLIQFDCGKLQSLDLLLRRLKKDGHRALIFTQMTKMLDILEEFINLHGYTYLRLDGSVKVEQRQKMMEKFNNDQRVFLFILSTRAGGLGINLTGADTVIFYDSDWNPAIDAQAQDRSHRIGQTREVNIYRLVSAHTIEENILKKARQKLRLDDIIKEGNFNTTFFKSILDKSENEANQKLETDIEEAERKLSSVSQVDLESALMTAEDEDDVAALKALKIENAKATQEAEEEANLQGDEFGIEAMESKLKKIQLYAVRFIEQTDPDTGYIDDQMEENSEQKIEAETMVLEEDEL